MKRARTGDIIRANEPSPASTKVGKNNDSDAMLVGGYVADSTNEISEVASGSKSSARTNNRYGEYFNFQVVDKVKIGICKICKKDIKMQNSNTSGIKWHLKNKHRAVHDQLFPATPSDKQQKTLEDTFRQTKQKQVLIEKGFHTLLVEWISTKFLPLNIFDDDSSQSLFRAINPELQFPKRTSLTSITSSTYKEVRAIVMDLLKTNNSRISFTVDGWTSIRSKSYYGITAHFIDEDWKMHSLATDFIPCHGQHAGVDIAAMFYDALEKSGLVDKILGITLDNASSNTTFMKKLEEKLREEGVTFDAEEQHFRCFAHVLNLAVQDVLRILKVDNTGDGNSNETDTDDDSDVDCGEAVSSRRGESTDRNTIAEILPIAKLRYLCKKIKKSEKLKLKLGDYCKVFEEKLIDVPLDVSTRWNSSFDLITAGLKMQKAMSALASNNADLKRFYICEAEWDVLSMLQKYLKCFKKLSTILCGDQYATLPSVVVGINVLIDSIEKLCHALDEKPDRSKTDESVILAFQSGRDKISKHYDMTNWIYCAVLILDPRHKLETFDLTSWGKELKKKSYEEFENIFRTKYSEVTDETYQSSERENDSDTDDDDYSKGLNALYAPAKNIQSWRIELDNYLRLGRANGNVNILEWWKQNEKCFPRLARMAQDYLAICASSAPVERLFSRAGLIIRKHRNGLSNQNAEILLCLNSWFKSTLSSTIKAKLR